MRRTQVFRDLDENPADETFPGIAVLRLDGGLFFATAERSRIASATSPRTATAGARSLDLEGVAFVDSQAHEDRGTQKSPRPTASRCGWSAKPQVLAVLQADGVVDRIGADHIHGNVHRAVEAQPADPS